MKNEVSRFKCLWVLKLQHLNVLEFLCYNKIWTEYFSMTLNLTVVTLKSIDVFLSLSSTCAWSMKSVGWKRFEWLHYNKLKTGYVAMTLTFKPPQSRVLSLSLSFICACSMNSLGCKLFEWWHNEMWTKYVTVTLTFDFLPQNFQVFSFLFPPSVYEIWSL